MPATILHPEYGGTFASDTAGALAFVLPGERVELSPDLAILEPSPARVAPGCEHFGVCGGCHYQHAIYDAQPGLKREILVGILAAAGVTLSGSIQIEAAEPWGYRNRIRLRLQSTPGGALEVGYSRRGSNTFLPIRMCPIAAPLLPRTAFALLALSSEDPQVRRWLDSVSELELFTTPAEDRLQLQFFLREADAPEPVFVTLCERLAARIPELAGAGAIPDPDLPRRSRLSVAALAWGAPGLLYPAAGRAYWVSRGAFFQVNRFLIDRLIHLVLGQLPPGTPSGLAWDLFAGVGLFTRPLAERFAHVIAVEAAEAAATDLRQAGRGVAANLARNEAAQPAFEAVQSSTLDFLRARSLQRERPGLVVVDPPRAGLGPEASELLARIAPAHIVYVSCDPSTLARDLAILCRSAYTLASVHLIDLFPQTFHIETVVHLDRK